MRFYMFTIIIVGIVLILNLGGIVTPTGDALGLTKGLKVVDDQGITLQNIKNSDVWDDVRTLLLIALGATIVIGVFGRAPDIRYLTAALVFGLGSLLLTDLIYLFTIIKEPWIKTGVGVLLSGLAAGFIITMIQFWQGTD